MGKMEVCYVSDYCTCRKFMSYLQFTRMSALHMPSARFKAWALQAAVQRHREQICQATDAQFDTTGSLTAFLIIPVALHMTLGRCKCFHVFNMNQQVAGRPLWMVQATWQEQRSQSSQTINKHITVENIMAELGLSHRISLKIIIRCQILFFWGGGGGGNQTSPHFVIIKSMSYGSQEHLSIFVLTLLFHDKRLSMKILLHLYVSFYIELHRLN